MSEKILVLGATGTVGKAVIDRLENESVEVFAAVRDLSKGDFGPNVHRRYLDYTDPASYAPAFAGIDRVFAITPPFFEQVPEVFGELFAVAHTAGVSQVVLSTALGTNYNPASEHYAVERSLEQSGLDYTILRPNFYAQNYLTYDRANTLAGIIAVPASDGKASYIDVRDIAEATWQAFHRPEARNRAYDLTGPESLDQYEIARILGEVTGRPTRYLNPSEADYEAELRQYQVPESAVAQLKAVYSLIREGIAAPVAPGYQELTGQAPTSFQQFAHDHLN